MGKSTSVICNHQLDISSVENLAKDLANRLQATIQYGYCKTWYFSEDNKIKYDYEFIEFGIIEGIEKEKKYQLIDVNYGSKQFIHQNGIEILESNEFKIDIYDKQLILDEIDSIEFELDEVFENDIESIGYIYKNTIDLWIVDSLDWYGFQRKFLYHIDASDLTFLNSWRQEIKKWITIFGGNFVFVYSYCENSSGIQEILERNPLKDSLEIINNNFSDTLVNISKYLINKQFENRPIYVQEISTTEQIAKHIYAIENNIDFFPVKVNYPILFYDDFKDLDSNFNTTHYFDFLYNGNHVFEQEAENEKFQNNFKTIRKEVNLPELSNYFKIYDCFVTGYKHHQAINIDIGLIKNQEVYLSREPENKFDKHAIALYVDFEYVDEINSLKIGYIAKYENYILSKLLDNGIELRAFLVKINEKEIYNKNYNNALKIQIYMIKP